MKTTEMKYKLAQSSWDSEEIEVLKQVINEGNFTMGKNVKEFEESFADYFGSKHAVMVNSGSSANLLGVASLFFKKSNPLTPGDEVIVPAVSWSTSYSPLQQYGLKLKFVDIDIHTLNYNIDELEKAITEKTKLILIVNLLGNPNEFSRIKQIVKERDIILFEDNCESMGAKYKNEYTGTIGEIGTFSMFYSHHICTMEGGMILTDNLELYHILVSLRAHGWTRELPKVNSLCVKEDDTFNESFKFILPGYNLRPLEMSAAVGKVQLKKLEKFIETRRKNAEIFKDLFSSFEEVIIQKEVETSSWFGFSIVLNNKLINRGSVLKKLSNKGIETRPIVSGNILNNPMLKYFNYEISGEIINAEKISKNGFFVGNSHLDLEQELNFFKTTLYESLY
jgi:CDP-6-deoxy-D-xylo-4-hexulose-3-dehydrase